MKIGRHRDNSDVLAEGGRASPGVVARVDQRLIIPEIDQRTKRNKTNLFPQVRAGAGVRAISSNPGRLQRYNSSSNRHRSP
jgi:hypothetical protein